MHTKLSMQCLSRIFLESSSETIKQNLHLRGWQSNQLADKLALTRRVDFLTVIIYKYFVCKYFLGIEFFCCCSSLSVVLNRCDKKIINVYCTYSNYKYIWNYYGVMTCWWNPQIIKTIIVKIVSFSIYIFGIMIVAFSKIH